MKLLKFSGLHLIPLPDKDRSFVSGRSTLETLTRGAATHDLRRGARFGSQIAVT
jgi:hypothetical protein